MDPVPEPPPNAVSESAGRTAATSRWMLPKIPLLIGVAGIGAAVTAGTWFKHRSDERQQAELQAIRAEVAALSSDAAEYRARIGSLRQEAERMHAAADRPNDERNQAWAHERARCFDALIARLDRAAQEPTFDRLAAAIEAACARRQLRNARELLLQIPELRFPSSARFRELQSEHYLQPLAAVSRQNPAYFRAFQRFEPEAARQNIAELRQELMATDLDAVTPQSMLKLELYSTVAAPGDPLVEDWKSVASAADYFDQPDAATLAAWRRAQRAVRREDWPTAVAQMQSILRSTVRTRLPFRAAFAHTLLKNRPEDKATAYPFMQEAAAAGDSEARAWMIQEDLQQGRPAQAVRWLENAVAAGETAAIPKLLDLYGQTDAAVPRDAAREIGVLQRITVAPDAPPYASMLLARLYEEGNGVAASSGNAFAYYRRAAEQKHVAAWPQVARCHLRGIGTPVDKDQAVKWACQALAAGEREYSLPLLNELMKTDPDRTAGPLQEMFEHEQIAAPAGFENIRLYGPSMAQLQTALARYFDQKGKFGPAARFYAASGNRDPSVRARHAALTAGRRCDACLGTGKVHSSVNCPTCGGRGSVICHFCDGRGYSLVPGTPPCSTCSGSGTMVQQGRRLACGTCGGTGKGKGSVVRQSCTACTQGREPCHECTGGRIRVTKECPECHGTGARSLADQ